MTLRHRACVTLLTCLSCALLTARPGPAAPPAAPRGELRVVDPSPLNWVSITLNVFEHLMEFDHDGKLVPRLATGWRWLDDRTIEFTLRQGVKFHNGEAFDAAIVKLNWEENTRARQPHLPGTFLNFRPGSRIEIVDPLTVRFVFPEPDGAALAKLAIMHLGNRQFYQEVGWGEQHWWMISAAGPWGTGPYKLLKGFSLPDKRSGEVVLEANTRYWDRSRFPRVKRIVFDNTIRPREALELLMRGDRRVDMVTGISPVDTLRVAQSAHAAVIKKRNFHGSVLGFLNTRKPGSPWSDIRVRQAANLAINRADLIRYGANGNGKIVPALVPTGQLGHPDGLAPYPFDPERARALLREAGHPDGLAIRLIAPESLRVQATVVARMLGHVGFTVEPAVLDPSGYNRRVSLPLLDRPAEQETWDIAVGLYVDWLSFPPLDLYQDLALGGPLDWVDESPELRRLLDQVLRTVDARDQEKLIQQMERLASEQAYFLFLYQPIDLVAVKKHVTFVPYPTYLILAEAAVGGPAR